jgi:hypothetical protein
MQLDYFDIGLFFLIFILSTLFFGLFFKKHLINILDIWIIVFLNQIIFISVIIYSYTKNEIKPEHFFYCLISLISFIFGLNTFYKKSLRIQTQRFIIDYNTTKISIYIYSILFIINGSLIFYYLGVPFFISGNRTITSYSELGSGFGILNYLNWGLQSILYILALKIWIYDKNKKLGISILIMLLIFNMLNGGGKGVYLSLLLSINLGIYYMHISKNEKFQIPSFFKYALFLLPFFILGAFVGAVNAGYESNVFLAFIKRLIGGAEGPYYYFIQNSYSKFHGLNLFSYHFSQILPYFGYIDRNAIDLGVNLSLFSDLNFGESGHGPNPTMYVIGHIALGSFGFIYCYIIGTLLSYIRYRLESTFLIWMYLNLNIISLIGDGTLMPLDMFYIALLSPVLIWAFIVSRLNNKEIKLV